MSINVNSSIQPTYEELKLTCTLVVLNAGFRIQPTYEELKHLASCHVPQVAEVSSLPMRN